MEKLTLEQVNNLKIGDKIEIVTFQYMEGRTHTTRIIRNILETPENELNKIFVHCFGWKGFLLREGEILKKLNN